MSKEHPLVLVTGSSGLLGSGVVRKLAEAYQVVGFDIVAPKAPLPSGASFIECDLSAQASVDNALDQVDEQHGREIASVVHLAAYVDFSGEASDKYDKITVGGTRRLLAGLEKFQLEQFVFSSTMLVHAPTEPGKPIKEDSPIHATWAYPESKVRTEQVIREARGETPAVILRIAGVYDDGCHSIPLAQQIRRIHERHMTGQVFPGNASHGQALVHYEDTIEAFRLAVDRRRELATKQSDAPLALLIGEPETLSYEELQRTFSQLIHGETWHTRRVPKSLAKAGAWVQAKMSGDDEPFIKPWMIDRADDHYDLDITRARELLGWEPKHALRDTLPKMVEALKRDPEAWYREHNLPASAVKPEPHRKAG